MKKKYFIIAFIILVITLYLVSVTPSYDTIDVSVAIKEATIELKKNQQIVIFNSKNPFNFYDIFYNIDKISDQKVFGVLTKPSKEGIYPIVIGVAGSAGWDEHHYRYLDRFIDNGIAVFSLHSFKSRKVESTVGEQLKVTMPMMIYDSFMALNKLSEFNNIDIKRAGITGWSLGGGVSLFSAWTPIQEFISPKLKFAAHLPFYPPCMIIPNDIRFNNVPIHILAGELDDWVPAEACKELKYAANELGYNIDLTIYPDAPHSFDRLMDVVLSEDAYSFTNCRMKLSNNGIVTLLNGFPLSSPILQKIGLSFCANKGAHWGGNENARNKSSKFALNFMINNLK